MYNRSESIRICLYDYLGEEYVKLEDKKLQNIPIPETINENSDDDNFAGKFRMTNSSNFMELGFGIDLYLFFFKCYIFKLVGCLCNITSCTRSLLAIIYQKMPLTGIEPITYPLRM